MEKIGRKRVKDSKKGNNYRNKNFFRSHKKQGCYKRQYLENKIIWWKRTKIQVTLEKLTGVRARKGLITINIFGICEEEYRSIGTSKINTI